MNVLRGFCYEIISPCLRRHLPLFVPRLNAYCVVYFLPAFAREEVPQREKEAESRTQDPDGLLHTCVMISFPQSGQTFLMWRTRWTISAPREISSFVLYASTTRRVIHTHSLPISVRLFELMSSGKNCATRMRPHTFGILDRNHTKSLSSVDPLFFRCCSMTGSSDDPEPTILWHT